MTGVQTCTLPISLDWGPTATEINTSEPTDAELNEVMDALRAGLAKCKEHLPYAYTTCRREVAKHLKDILIIEGGYTDKQVLVTKGDIPEEDCFYPEKNYYVYTIGIAKHPMAFKKLRRVTGDL